MQKLNYLTGAMSDKSDGALVQQMLQGMYNRLSTVLINSAALAAGGTTSKIKIAAAIDYMINGAVLTKAITDNFWTPDSGMDVADGKTNVYCCYINAAGEASMAMGTAVTTVTAGRAAGVKFPPLPENKVMVGYVVVSASGGAFTGGTSAFATAGNFTVQFVNTVGVQFDPTATI